MPTVEEAEVVEYFDDMLAHLELKEKILIRSLVALLEVQTLVFNGVHPKLFTQASPQERTKNLKGWEKSRIFQRRLVFMAIRTLLLWAYVDSQEAERDMGFVAGTRRTAERNAERKAVARRAIAQARGEEHVDADDVDVPLELDAPQGAFRAAESSSPPPAKEQA